MAEIQSGLDTSDSGGIQGDLFGEDDSAMQEIVAISKAAGELVKENKQKIAAVSGAVKRPEIAREMGVDINNPEQVKAAIQALEYENSRLMSPTPEIEILNKIRRRAGLSEVVDDSVSDTEVDVHHDDDATFDLGFDARKEKRDNGKFKTDAEFILWLLRTDPKFAEDYKSKSENQSELANFLKVRLPALKKRYNVQVGDNETKGKPIGMRIKYDDINKFLLNVENQLNKKKGPEIDCFYDFGVLSPGVVSRIKKKTGLDLTGFIHSITSSHIYHAFDHHGDKQKEEARGQIPISIGDWELVDDIVDEFDDVKLLQERSKTGNNVLLFTKEFDGIDGSYVYCTEVRIARKKIVSATLWKFKNKKRKSTTITNAQQNNSVAPRVTSSTHHSLTSNGQQSENSAESQGENSDNLNPSLDKRVDGSQGNLNNVDANAQKQAEVQRNASESYNVIRKLASVVFKARKAILSRKIYDGGRILPRGIKLDKTTNRLVGMCSIADIRRYISKAFELPIDSGIRDGGKRMLGAYWNSLQAIAMRSGHLNDIQTISHELGHHLEMILFGYTLNGKTVSTKTLMSGLN